MYTEDYLYFTYYAFVDKANKILREHIKMKKAFILTMTLLISLSLFACGKKATPIILPTADEVVSISVVSGDITAACTDEEWIGETMSILMDMESTTKESVNDVPSVDNYVVINFNCSDDTVKSIYFYENKGQEYVEQVYQGIYIPAPALGTQIADLLNTIEN